MYPKPILNSRDSRYFIPGNLNTLKVLKHSMVQRYRKSQDDTHKASPSHSHLPTQAYILEKNKNALHPSPPVPLPTSQPQLLKLAESKERHGAERMQLQRRKPPRKNNSNRYGSTISITVSKVTKRKQEIGKHHRNQLLSRVLAFPPFPRNPLTHTETNRLSSPPN